MLLKKGIFVNWGNIPHLEFEFGPINLFSGGNGSGKTTAADAIQSLMTAAYENLFNYNPGQDETTQKGRGGKQVRTLASYVLGCDDGSYARPQPSDGYVAGIFHPTQGESAEAFTAVMCMRAHVDTAGNQKQARLDELTFIILPGEQLSLSHFVRSYPDGKHIVPLDSISTLLKKEFGSKNVEVYDKKGAYLRRLYGALRGRRDAVSDREAKHAARTFSNFMAYKPVKSINEFVAREIMEPKDLGDAIRNVSDLMKTIHQMESDTRAIRDSITILARAKEGSQTYIDTWIERSVARYTEASRRVQLNQKNYISAKTEQKATLEAIAETENRIDICEQRRSQIHEQRIALEAQRQGIQALQDKDQLESLIAKNNRELVEKARPLLEQDQQLSRNAQNSQALVKVLAQCSLGASIPALDAKEFRTLAKTVAASVNDGGIDLTQLLGTDWIDIAPLENYLDQVLSSEIQHRRWAEFFHAANQTNSNASIRDQVAQQLNNHLRKRQDGLQKLQQKQREITLLESRKVSYPAYVETALQAINKSCPEADPRVLCDYIEVIDERWQMAIEGYIGGARFSIMVEPEYEAEAIRIVRNLPDARRSRARVIQGGKASRDSDRLSLARESILGVMEFSHKTAEFYLRASYGSVLRVESAEVLRNTARGLTPEGLASGNYSMWRCDLDDSELVFGQNARERALKAKQRECEQLTIEANNVEQDYQYVARAFELIESIKPVVCSDVIQAMLRLHRESQAAESALARIDLSDFEQLEQQLQQLKSSYKEQEEQNRELGKEVGRLQERERQYSRKVKELADAVEVFQQSQEAEERNIENIANIHLDFDSSQALQTADTRAANASDFNFEDEVQTLSGRLEKIERELYQTILAHNQHCNQHDAIVYDTGFGERHGEDFFQRIVKLTSEADLIHNRLKNNVLISKYDKLLALKDSFNTAFVTNLCHSIYQAISDGKRILDDLNRELESHRFGADRERFYFGYEWVPEYREYWRFFKEVIDLPNLGDGASLFDAELSDSACNVRDKMLAMLLDKDEQVALRELGRISDYRHYRHYEIYKEPEGKAPIALSQYGTGSGGQLETPAYIIRSAAVTSAFRFNEGSAHLRMVLVDEAFSKMDETRSREVINYLTETLGLQLVFIMPTSKSGPFMDLISNQFVFSKCPTATAIGELKTRVLVDRKACNQEKIKALWANHRKLVRHQGMLDFMDAIDT
ncbi:ATP-binding protein [Teredinibacter waterburyi]|uniref:ATP-binding protein n=1 Tax=Teredinibacter waterburyi TaxID=1500538 RepID=UPI00165F6B04|nr:SbcC/MukB-like Walker B domain-containing protein [Teredinibacter waterburyi]